MTVTERPQLDDIDLRILSELQRDGRIRINELAERVGITAPPCLRRVRALRGRGVIQAIRATLDERLLGYEVTTFVLIQLDSQTLSAIEAFEAAVAAVPRFLQCWRISGDADFMLPSSSTPLRKSFAIIENNPVGRTNYSTARPVAGSTVARAIG